MDARNLILQSKAISIIENDLLDPKLDKRKNTLAQNGYICLQRVELFKANLDNSSDNQIKKLDACLSFEVELQRFGEYIKEFKEMQKTKEQEYKLIAKDLDVFLKKRLEFKSIRNTNVQTLNEIIKDEQFKPQIELFKANLNNEKKSLELFTGLKNVINLDQKKDWGKVVFRKNPAYNDNFIFQIQDINNIITTYEHNKDTNIINTVEINQLLNIAQVMPIAMFDVGEIYIFVDRKIEVIDIIIKNK